MLSPRGRARSRPRARPARRDRRAVRGGRPRRLGPNETRPRRARVAPHARTWVLDLIDGTKGFLRDEQARRGRCARMHAKRSPLTAAARPSPSVLLRAALLERGEPTVGGSAARTSRPRVRARARRRRAGARDGGVARRRRAPRRVAAAALGRRGGRRGRVARAPRERGRRRSRSRPRERAPRLVEGVGGHSNHAWSEAATAAGAGARARAARLSGRRPRCRRAARPTCCCGCRPRATARRSVRARARARSRRRAVSASVHFRATDRTLPPRSQGLCGRERRDRRGGRAHERPDGARPTSRAARAPAGVRGITRPTAACTTPPPRSPRPSPRTRADDDDRPCVATAPLAPRARIPAAGRRPTIRPRPLSRGARVEKSRAGRPPPHGDRHLRPPPRGLAAAFAGARRRGAAAAALAPRVGARARAVRRARRGRRRRAKGCAEVMGSLERGELLRAACRRPHE